MRLLNISFLLSLVFFAFSNLNASTLPKKKKLKSMSIHSVGIGKNLTMNGLVELPDGQKLNEKAPNQISVYEKLSSGWKLVKKVNLNVRLAIPGMDLQVSEPIQLSSDKSEIAIDATIYHCALDNSGVCYIDNFQKPVVRRSSSRSEISFTVHPTKM